MAGGGVITHVTVILFKPSGKYYTEERWKIPTLQQALAHPDCDPEYVRGDLISPYGMKYSPDFRRIGEGAVLVPSQEPWGYPHLFPNQESTT